MLDGSAAPFYRWYPDGVMNTCYNALDRHVEAAGDQPALHYVSPVTDTMQTLTYDDLLSEVSRFAGVLTGPVSGSETGWSCRCR